MNSFSNSGMSSVNSLAKVTAIHATMMVSIRLGEMPQASNSATQA